MVMILATFPPTPLIHSLKRNGFWHLFGLLLVSSDYLTFSKHHFAALVVRNQQFIFLRHSDPKVNSIYNKYNACARNVGWNDCSLSI